MNFNLKLKKIRTFRKMTQKELSEKIGLTDQHRIVQYEKGVRVPKKDLVDKMAQALDVNPYTLYDTAGRDASEMMELLFWLDEFNPSALHLFLPRKFPGEKCNEVADTSVYYHDNDSWPAHAPVCMWFDYGVLNDFLKEWVVRMDELKSGEIARDEYFEWKINWPQTCDGCGKYEPKKQWRSVCIFRKNCTSVPEERSAIPLQTEQSSAGLLVTVVYSTIPAREFKTICLGCHSA